MAQNMDKGFRRKKGLRLEIEVRTKFDAPTIAALKVVASAQRKATKVLRSSNRLLAEVAKHLTDSVEIKPATKR